MPPYEVAVSREAHIFVLHRCDLARAAALHEGLGTLAAQDLGECGKGCGAGDGQCGRPSHISGDPYQ